MLLAAYVLKLPPICVYFVMTLDEFEKMPVIRYGDILRNILYSGVWCRFAAIGQKRREEREKEKKC